MTSCEKKLNVVLIGGGMISTTLILPLLFQERREGRINSITLSSLDVKTNNNAKKLFPGEHFFVYPDPDKVKDEDKPFPEEYKNAVDSLESYGVVIVATPDHTHTPIILYSLEKGKDVICQKPLCLKADEVWQMHEKAQENGLYLYTDYHKRHDRAVRGLRHRIRKGDLGEILYGHGWIEDKIEIPVHHFKAWAHKSSSFEFVGIHYVDVYYYVTGLRPKRLIAFGQKKLLTKTLHKDTYDAVEAVIEWENGSVCWIQTNWILPRSTTAMSNQGFQITGTKGEYKSDHKNRNCYFVTDEGGFEHYNPNFFREYESWKYPGKTDYIGYGYESIAQGLDDIRNIHTAVEELNQEETLKKRKEMIQQLEEIRPLPMQALIGTVVNEGVRLSMENKSRWIEFDNKMYP
ncbi:Gfo/Idh/MocA family protein, partial [candidate division KSB1 bacterium]